MASVARLCYLSSYCARLRTAGRARKVQLKPNVLRGLSTAKSWRSGGAKLAQTIKNDPFVKLSLSLFVIVVGGTAVLEIYNKFKKRSTQAVSALPPSFGHRAVKRVSLLRQIEKKLHEVANKSDEGCPVLYVTGPAGCGKTQVLNQFCTHFIQAHQYKWFGLKRVFPIVIYLDASSPASLALTVTMAMKALSMKEEKVLERNVSAMMECLKKQQVPWLLMIDGFTDKTASEAMLTAILKQLSECSSRQGCALVAGQVTTPPDVEAMAIPSRFTEEEASELLSCVGHFESQASLVESLGCHPLATALAASTISTYQAFLHLDSTSAAKTYSELLMEQMKLEETPLQAALKLYFEVAVSDVRLRHVFDLLGSLDSDSPILSSVVADHLHSMFYAIPSDLLVAASPQVAVEDVVEHSYLDYVKPIKDYLFPKPGELGITEEDKIGYLRHCPLLLFMKSSQNDFELIGVQPSAVHSLRWLFTESTCDKLDEDHCRLKENEFQQKSWFKRYRAFNKTDCLASYHRALPGLVSPGVITPRLFASMPHKGYDLQGTAVPEDLSYSQYVHIVSHYHRVLGSMSTLFHNAKGDIHGNILERVMVPHLKALMEHPLLSQADRLKADILTADIQVLLISGKELEAYLLYYEGLINEQKRMLGSQSLILAATLTNYADLLLSVGKSAEAQTMLQTVLGTYKKLSTRARDQACVDVGHAMSSMGRAFAQLGDHRQSKDWYEHALTTYQTIPEQGHATKKHQNLISSSLIDVARAYLVLGDLPVAKKYSELAYMVLESLYPKGNSETVRILRISSIINSLMGNKEESAKQMSQASKIEAKL